MGGAIELLEDLIADLEGKLNLGERLREHNFLHLAHCHLILLL